MLAKSPKLDRQCNGDFEEAKRKRIDLDHDPKTFALLLEFLYTGDYWPFLGEEFRENRSEDEDVRATQLQREGDLYCLAEYYQMDDLQELAVKKMQVRARTLQYLIAAFVPLVHRKIAQGSLGIQRFPKSGNTDLEVTTDADTSNV